MEYLAMYPWNWTEDDTTTPPDTLIVRDQGERRGRILSWVGEKEGWQFNLPYIFRAMSWSPGDDQFRTPQVSRQEAERIAREVLGIALPSEADLARMFEEGQQVLNRQRWQASLIRAYGRPWTTLGKYIFQPIHPEEKQITYYASYPSPQAQEPTGVAILVPAKRELRAVAWAPSTRAWVYAPDRVGRFLRSLETDQEKEVVDRLTAERIARQALGVELPSEEEILRICAEAEREQIRP